MYEIDEDFSLRFKECLYDRCFNQGTTIKKHEKYPWKGYQI